MDDLTNMEVTVTRMRVELDELHDKLLALKDLAHTTSTSLISLQSLIQVGLQERVDVTVDKAVDIALKRFGRSGAETRAAHIYGMERETWTRLCRLENLDPTKRTYQLDHIHDLADRHKIDHE